MTLRLGAIEAGGTKFVCGIGNEHGEVLDQIRIETKDPEHTMAAVLAYLSAQHQEQPLDAIGLGCFGPIAPDPDSPVYGHITTTPKPGWQHFDIVGAVRSVLDVPIGFDTDVNAASLGEHYWGNAQDVDTFVYVTVGTGIGGGVMVRGKLLHGAMHPEMGHIFVPQDRTKDDFDGVCPFHGNCLEGLASGPSIKARWQVESALDLPADHPAWDLEAEYLSYAMVNYTLTLSPKRIILGGGVMEQSQLLGMIQKKTEVLLAGYIDNHYLADMATYIQAPGLQKNAGLCGSLALAKQAVG